MSQSSNRLLSPNMNTNHTTRSPWPHRWAWVLACAVFPLVWWGGLVTTTGAGMAFRDWLTSDGHWMPFYPWLSSSGDKFVEHGHRLLGMLVGMLAIGMVGIAWKFESRDWVRKLSFVVLGGIILQGVLGGMRVVFDEQTLALLHGCTGPLVFALCVALVVVTSRWWLDCSVSDATPQLRKFLRLAVLTTGLAYGQLVLGAVVRHSPRMTSDSAAALFQIAVYLHLFVALAIVVHAVLLVVQSARTGFERGRSWLLAGLVGLQVLLGSFTWVVKYGLPRWAADLFGELQSANTADNLGQAAIVTSHVAVGSLILVLAGALSLRLARQARIVFPLVLVPMASQLEGVR